MSSKCNRWIAWVGIVLFGVIPCRADWFIIENPQTHSPEAVWSHAHDGVVDICYASLEPSGWTEPMVLGPAVETSTGPALTVAPNGDRAAAWQGPGGHVFMRSWPASELVWRESVEVSGSEESARAPFILAFGDMFVSYEVVSEDGTRWVSVAKVDPDGTPQRQVVRMTASTEALDTGLAASQSVLLMDWIDSSSSIGYSTYRSGEWSVPEFLSYEGTSARAIREQLRQSLTEN